ncbi:MAG TPA: TetR/AcrR family transcriptional regulator [Acidimicrobiia bacterium]|nr:TetR/AcrR family transcriptional regulator [Acidimicrobiia bacterium]
MAAATDPGTRRRGRPATASGPAVTRAAIVDAATAALAGNGYASLSLRGLARSLGVSLAAVQHHFPTKDALWRAAIDALFADFDAPVPIDGTPEPATLLRARIHTLVERMAAHPGLSAALWNDRAPGAEARLEHLHARASSLLDRARIGVGTAIEFDVARRVDVDVFLALIGVGISSLASSPDALARLFALDTDDAAQRTRLADSLTDILLHGLLARPDTRS